MTAKFLLPQYVLLSLREEPSTNNAVPTWEYYVSYEDDGGAYIVASNDLDEMKRSISDIQGDHLDSRWDDSDFFRVLDTTTCTLWRMSDQSWDLRQVYMGDPRTKADANWYR